MSGGRAAGPYKVLARVVMADRPIASAPPAATPASPRRPFVTSAEDMSWWAANSPTRHESYSAISPLPAPVKGVESEHGDFPSRRPGVDRGPMKRRPSNGQTGITDFDLFNHIEAVG